MKLTSRAFILLFAVLFISRESFCQEAKNKEINYNVSALIGTAAYSWPTYGEGGLHGVNYSLSAGIQLSETVNFAIQVDYSSFRIAEDKESEIEVSYQPYPIYSFSGEIIPKLWGGLNIILGGGVFYQKTGTILYHVYNSKEKIEFTERRAEYEGVDIPKFHGVFGFGGDIKLNKALSLLLQTRFFIRNDHYAWFMETGLKYNF